MAINTVYTVAPPPGWTYWASSGRLVRDSLGRIYLLFQETRIDPFGFGTDYLMLGYSDNNGVSWTIETVTTLSAPNIYDIAIDSLDRVQIVYAAPGIVNPANPNNIRHRTRDRATGWSAPFQVTDNAWNTGAGGLAMAIRGNDTIIVVWTDNRTGGLDDSLYSRERIGAAWQPESLIIIEPGGNTQANPYLCIGANGTVHLTWSGAGWGAWPLISNIQYMYQDGGWSPRIPVTDEPDQQQEPTIAVDLSGNVHFAWQNAAILPPYGRYRRYVWGAGWDPVETIVADNPSQSHDITVDATGNIFVGFTIAIGGINYAAFTTKPVGGIWQFRTLIAEGESFFSVMKFSVSTIAKNLRNNLPMIGFALDFSSLISDRLYYYASESPYTLVWPSLPVVIRASVVTLSATDVTENAAVIHGVLASDGGEICRVRFQWGTTTAYGMETPWQDGISTGSTFSVRLTGLAEGNAFHFRAVAFNSRGVVYGNDMTFNTLSTLGPVTLIDDEIMHILEAV